MAQSRPMVMDFPGVKSRWNAGGCPGIWEKRITFADMNSVAALTTSIDITKFPPGAMVLGVHLILLQVFSGGTVASFTFSVGTTASGTLFVNAADCFTGAALGSKVGVAVVPGQYLGLAATPNGLGTLRLTPTTTTANLSALTQGKLMVCVLLQGVRVPKS